MRKKMWFGTPNHSQWIDVPLRGAEMSPQSMATDGTLVSGGGYSRYSLDSHREYMFEWGAASSRESAETMQAYRDGAYSADPSDLIYFHDPLTYDRNILPKRWAQPSILVPPNLNSFTNTPLGRVSRVDHSLTPPWTTNRSLPMEPVTVSSPIKTGSPFQSLINKYRSRGALWIPIPTGMSLSLTSWVSATPESGYFAMRRNGSSWGSPVKLSHIPTTFSGDGVLLGVVGVPHVFGARGVLFDPARGLPFDAQDPVTWMPGSGNSGCRFVGNPTWTANSGVNGGQIGYATTLKEVGDWDK